VVQDTCASRLLGIDGLTVTEVEGTADGHCLVCAVTSADVAPICPTCRTPSTNPKCRTTTVPRDLDIGGRRCVLVWCKRRWYCRCRDCPATSFAETVPRLPRRPESPDGCADQRVRRSAMVAARSRSPAVITDCPSRSCGRSSRRPPRRCYPRHRRRPRCWASTRFAGARPDSSPTRLPGRFARSSTAGSPASWI
jgi:hypothetical protein